MLYPTQPRKLVCKFVSKDIYCQIFACSVRHSDDGGMSRRVSNDLKAKRFNFRSYGRLGSANAFTNLDRLISCKSAIVHS